MHFLVHKLIIMLHNLKLLASLNTVKIELCYIIRKYAQKSAQVGNAHAKRCMVCAQMLTMFLQRAEHSEKLHVG